MKLMDKVQESNAMTIERLYHEHNMHMNDINIPNITVTNVRRLRITVSADIYDLFIHLFPLCNISCDPNADSDIVIISVYIDSMKEFRHVHIDYTLNISSSIINRSITNRYNFRSNNRINNINNNKYISNTHSNTLNIYFIPINNVLSMQRNIFNKLFIDKDYHLLIFELEKFFKKCDIAEIYCKGKIATELGEQLNIYNKNNKKYNKHNNKIYNNNINIRRLIIFDRTEDIITPLSFNLEPIQHLLDLCKAEEDFIEKINIKSEIEILSEYILFNMCKKGEYESLKRELIYTYGPKLLKFFSNVNKIRRKKPIFLPDLCRAVKRQDIENYRFDRIYMQDKDIDNKIKRIQEDVVLFIGGVSKKEIDKLKSFQVITTDIIDKKSFIDQLMN